MNKEILWKNQSSINTLVVGLEVHAQLLTRSKIYNSRFNGAYGSLPNTNVGVVTLSPRRNAKAEQASSGICDKDGLACHCSITRFNIFDRKNYFYPDLPKGYQITQDRTPLCKGGYVVINTKEGEEEHHPQPHSHRRRCG